MHRSPQQARQFAQKSVSKLAGGCGWKLGNERAKSIVLLLWRGWRVLVLKNRVYIKTRLFFHAIARPFVLVQSAVAPSNANFRRG